jgi:signal transduction histidine kinase
MATNDGTPERKDYLPILVLVGVFTLSASMLVVQYFHTKYQLEAEFRQGKTLAARYAAGEIRDFLVHEQTLLKDAAGLFSLSGDVEKGRASLDIILKSHKQPRKPFTFFVMDPKGRFLYSQPESLVDRYMQDLSGKVYFKEVVKSGEFYYSGVQPDGKGGWEIVLSTPVKTGGGEGGGRLLGVLAERIDISVLDRMFIGRIDAGPGGYAFLVDENGRLLASRKGSRLYQIEGSSEMLGRMLRGEEGAVLGNSPETGKPELTTFSPVLFGGRAWSVGIVSPSSDVHAEATRNLELTLLIITLMTIAFSWSIMSVARTRRYRAGLAERARVSDHLMLRNRELTALNDLSGAMGGGENLDGILRKALEIIIADTGAMGGAVRLVSPPPGDFVLKAWSGVPGPFIEKNSCAQSLKPYCDRAMAEGRPEYLSKESLKAAYPDCHDAVIEGIALVPLMVKNRPLGILNLWGLKEEDYSEERVKFLLAVGNQMAARVENAIQMEDTKRHSARASALFNTAQALTRSLDLDALLNIIMNETATFLKAKRCLLLLYSEEANRIDCRVSIGFENTVVGALSFNPSGVFWDAMEDGGVKVVDLKEKREDLPRKFIEVLGFDAFILVPLVSKGKVLGFIVIETQDNAGDMLEDIKLIVGFANQAAVAIETSSFYIRTVEKYNEDLQHLSNRIIEAQEEERKRISRDLHDELGQSLTAIKINLDMALDSLPPGRFEQIRSRLGDAVSLVLATLDSVRRLSFELRPSMLDDLGLSTVLGKLISDFRKRSGIEVEFSEEGPPERLNPQMEVVLYRVVQEALTNIAKHAKATKVVVSLRKDPAKDLIGLYIEDNGVGIPSKSNGYPGDSKGFGLMGIKERVSLLGGNFRIFAEENKGTKLLIDIPWTKGEVETWKEL